MRSSFRAGQGRGGTSTDDVQRIPKISPRDPTLHDNAEDTQALLAESAHQLRRAGRNRAAALANRRGRVLVVDDSEVFRRTAASLVSAAGELRLVGEAASGEEALELLPDVKPDLVLLDVHMPGLNGVETARIIREQRPEAVVALISTDPSGFEADARSAGVAALMNKAHLRPGTLDELWLKHRSSG